MEKKPNKISVEAFLRASELLNLNQIIEIGAHRAETSKRFMQKSGKSAFAIEANPYTLEMFTKKATEFGVTVLNMGIGNDDGKILSHIPMFSNALTPRNASFLQRKKEVDTTECMVDMIKLDNLKTNFESNNNTALWIDAEGYGLEVLGGASNFLKTYTDLIFIEVESVQHRKQQKTINSIMAYLEEYNFVPILRDFEYSSQFNLIFVHKDRTKVLNGLIDEFVKNFASISISKFDIAYLLLSRGFSRIKYKHFK